MTHDRYPLQLLFGRLLPQPFCGHCHYWKDVIASNTHEKVVKNVFPAARDQPQWKQLICNVPSPLSPKEECDLACY